MESSETIKKRFRKINKTDIAYSAGMLDAEGSISGTNHPDKSPNVYVRAFSGNECKVADWLQSLWGGAISSRVNPSGVPIYLLLLRRDETIRYLKLVKPFLRIKRAQAECALAFYSVYGAPAKRRRLVDKIQGLNRRFKIESSPPATEGTD